ncbi:hypothetical protein GF312_07355 [Candidatus Poribacteria bacterium]|nr:hypothetical protein [Candidatus Poribacteria bacterium]
MVRTFLVEYVIKACYNDAKVKNRDKEERQAWVRCDSYWWSMFVNKVEYQWDES